VANRREVIERVCGETALDIMLLDLETIGEGITFNSFVRFAGFVHT